VGLRGLTVNCTGEDNGRESQISCNGLTGHENISHIDVGGAWSHCRGGNVHFIDSSQLWIIASQIRRSMGDRLNGGSFAPCEIRTNHTASIWADDCSVESSGAGMLAVQAQETSVITLRNSRSVRGGRAGNITIAD